jgi:multidrug efflux pump subunit AcrA (membrane-fusion protein)
MTAPSHHLRQKREEAARRRLELAKLLRDDPKATNIALAKTLGVNRDTIALDRKEIMEQMTKSTLTETELMRAEMVSKLESLEAEVQLHRRDGKLPITAIDQLLSITKALVELTGCRKPVNEKMQVTHRAPITFNTVVVGADGKETPVGPTIDAELLTEPYALEAGDETR